MANQKRTLSFIGLLPKGLDQPDAMGLLVLQLEKDLRISIESKDPEDILLQVRKCLEYNAISGELMSLLYRVDLNENVTTKLLAEENWQDLSLAAIERVALKIALRQSYKN